MRKMYVSAAFAALALFSCTKEMEVPAPEKEQQPEAEKVWTVTVKATRRAADVTKVTLTDDGWEEDEADAAASGDVATKGLELDGDYLKSVWNLNEKVLAYDNLGRVIGELTPQSYGENTTVLSGTIFLENIVELAQEIPIRLYLIGSENERSYIGQKGTLEDIAENFDYAQASVLMRVNRKAGTITLSDANFESLQSINEFDFGVAKVKHLTISGAGIVGRSSTEAYVTVTPETPTNKLYVAISNSKAGVKIPYEFTAETDDGRTIHQTKKAALQNGKFYRTGINKYSAYNAASTPLTFEMLDDGEITIYNPNGLTIRWALNGSNTTEDSNEDPIIIKNLHLGDKVEFRSQNKTYGDSDADNSTTFYCRVKHYVYGNITSLRDGWFFDNTTGNPALKIAGDYAYANLFIGNRNMYNHPYKDILLPATEVGESSYKGMFRNCAGLARAPELPATKVANNCYFLMFADCTSLRRAPAILPAMRLAIYCYAAMFMDCSSLESAPELPAESVQNSWSLCCYEQMFKGCTSLKQIVCLAKDPLQDFMFGWVKGVPSSGYFRKHPDAVWIAGESGIPAGWGGQEPLTIEALEDGIITITNPQQLEVRYSKAADMSLSGATTDTRAQIEIPVNTGDKLRLWGDNAAYGHEVGPVSCTNIIGSGLHYVYGDLCSLISSGAYTSVTSLDPYAFASLFSGNDKLMSHPTEKLVIRPATVGDGCFRNMFQGCTALERAPELPATTLASYCYESMFSGCTALTQAPDLPATTLAEGSYGGMFFGCTALQNPPAISAQTLAMGCCMNMFSDCTSLKESPELKAQTLSQYCYSMMFSRCTSLKKITCTASNISAENALMDWVDGVPSGASGTFVKKNGVSWPSGNSGIPTGWSVQQSQ